MKEYSRHELDSLPTQLGLPSIYEENEDAVLVNGMLGKYKLWASKADRSVTPCLTGEIGGMPGAWENWVTSWHTKNLEQFDTYIDVGANCGYFSGLASHAQLSVISFEANPYYAELLKMTREYNKFDGWAIENKAVSNIDGQKVTLKIPSELHGGASIRGGATNLSGQDIQVDAISLNAVTGTPSDKVLVKMDIEGAEELAWEGAQRFNAQFYQGPTYILEYTPRHYSDSFFDSLACYGRVTRVTDSGDETTISKEAARSASDWITLVVRP